MSNEQLWPRVFVKLVRQNQAIGNVSTMWAETPWHVSHAGDPTAIQQWITEEFHGSWFANGALVACHTRDHIDDLLSEVTK